MKALLIATIATVTLAVGVARGQEPKTHEHEHAQPPAVAEENGKAGHMDMCARSMAMHEKMQEQMKAMQGQMEAMRAQMKAMKDKKDDKK